MKYRKKPVIVDAFKWTGVIDQEEYPEWIVDALKMKKVFFAEVCVARIIQPNDEIMLEIMTPKGRMYAYIGDYVIRGVKGEIYPCKPHIFEATYEKDE